MSRTAKNISKESRKPTTVRLTESMRESLRELASDNNLTVTDWIERKILEEIEIKNNIRLNVVLKVSPTIKSKLKDLAQSQNRTDENWIENQILVEWEKRKTN